MYSVIIRRPDSCVIETRNMEAGDHEWRMGVKFCRGHQIYIRDLGYLAQDQLDKAVGVVVLGGINMDLVAVIHRFHGFEGFEPIQGGTTHTTAKESFHEDQLPWDEFLEEVKYDEPHSG